MSIDKQSACKVNLLLNILSRRPDGFHELETVMHPVRLFDVLHFDRADRGIHFTCDQPTVPVDSTNLVCRAADAFMRRHDPGAGVRIHLEKRIPVAAGLGGGSGNAATTLIGLNELFDSPLAPEVLVEIAASLGSDIPFFLQNGPALGIGRGEQIQPLEDFPALKGAAFLLIHPGFGISTAWAYQSLKHFPSSLNGTPGRAQSLISLLRGRDLKGAGAVFYNSLEAPAFRKYPILTVYQDFLRANGAEATLMSGSGSTTFAVAGSPSAAETLAEKFKSKFGETAWTVVVPAAA